jgi:hypothetical protein
VGFYSLSTTILLATAALASLYRYSRKRGSSDVPISDTAFIQGEPEGLALSLCWASVVSSVLCLALLSVAYEYRYSSYPSVGFPYLGSGRLIAGSIVAFVVLWVQGLAVLFSSIPSLRVIGPVAVASLLAVGSAIAEAVLTWPIFFSAHNFFHLP